MQTQLSNFDDLIGKPYQPHAKGPDAFDCFGLMLEIIRRAGYARADFVWQHKAWSPSLVLPSPSIIAIASKGGRRPDHVGVVVDGKHLLHCTENTGVVREKLSKWRKQIRGIYTCN